MYQPLALYYMITRQCNERCSKCSHWKNKDNNMRLPVQNIIEALHECATIKEFCIVGGEPLLFEKEIVDIVKGIYNTPIRTTVITNGILMKPSFIDQIKDFNIHIVVSIDTLNKEFWKFVRGTNSYNTVMRNFEYAVKALPKNISIQSVLSKETEAHIKEITQYAEQKGLYHSIQPYVKDGFNGTWTPISKSYQNTIDEQQCFASERNISIMQNGDVFTCFQQNNIPGCEKPIGNLNKAKIKDLLASPYIIEVSKKMKSCNLPCKELKCNTK